MLHSTELRATDQATVESNVSAAIQPVTRG
jgi:hypothetical protein